MLAVHAGFVLDLNIVVAELLRFKMSKSFHSKHYTIIMLLTPETQTERERETDKQTDSRRIGEKESASEGGVFMFCFVFVIVLLGFCCCFRHCRLTRKQKS